jgi:hypothetical protein
VREDKPVTEGEKLNTYPYQLARALSSGMEQKRTLKTE